MASNGGPTPTMALLPISPGIDLVPAAGAPPTDQRGVLRPSGPAADVGAFEVGGMAAPLSVRRSGATVILSFSGEAGVNYRIERSANFSWWEFQESTGPLGASGVVTRTNAMNSALRFYRVTSDF